MASRTGGKTGRAPGKGSTKPTTKESAKGDKGPTSVLEIVPGKFNETDWLSILENDDTEDFIADIFEGIWGEASKKIQQIYVRKQLLPFTLIMTENALSNVIQWAFLERDEPKLASGDFWTEDSEPIPCTMDNWSEGVVPACREERPQSINETPLSHTERPSTAPVHISMSQNTNRDQRPSTGSSITSSIRTPRSSDQSKKTPKTSDSTDRKQRPKTEVDERTFTQKESSFVQSTSRSSFEQKPYFHDILVIQTQPPKLEPLSDLFYPPQATTTHSSSIRTTPIASMLKRRHLLAPKASSQLSSDIVASTTDLSGSIPSKVYRKPAELKAIDEQHVEEAICKAPAATHSMLKSILSRPPGYRELELDEFGNVIAIAKLDLDKIAPRSINVKCDIIKPRKPMIEARPPPAKVLERKKSEQYQSTYAAVKLVLPEQSTDVGDLIQPVPGVLYEDTRLRKGDPRRYQTGLSKYTNFYDENRPLKPIPQRNELAILQVATDLLRQAANEDSERDSQVPKLPRLNQSPPIRSASSTTSA